MGQSKKYLSLQTLNELCNWGINEDNLSFFKKIQTRIRRIIYIASQDPFNKEILNHASALSFKFILSLIPMLAMVFSIAKGFGVQDRVQPLLLQKLVGGDIASDLIPRIIEYVNNTNVAALGSIGLIFIIYTAISMLSQIEASFNTIWFVTRPRNIIRRISDYLAILLISPMLLAVTLGLSTTLQSHAFTQKLLEIGLLAGAMKLFLFSLPWLTSILTLTLLYIIIPNKIIRIVPALIAGILSGCSWQISQILFIKFQVGISNYNAIYGTFASVPIFMLWLHMSWTIVLFGGVLNYAIQSSKNFHPLKFENQTPFSSTEKICLAVFLLILKTFKNGKGSVTEEEISNMLGISKSLVKDALTKLITIGMVLKISGKTVSYTNTLPSDKIMVPDFFKRLKGREGKELSFRDEDIKKAVFHILDLNEKIMKDGFADIRIDELV